MTVDREQIRRDAESFVGEPSWAMSETERRLARHCLALLDELERIEREHEFERDDVAFFEEQA